MERKVTTKKNVQTKPRAPHKLVMIVTVVNRKKNDFFIDVLQQYEVNVTMTLMGTGTSKEGFFSQIDSLEKNKAVILGVVRQDKVKEIMTALLEKFDTVRGGNGVAFTVPLSSVIGVSSYKFLANKER